MSYDLYRTYDYLKFPTTPNQDGISAAANSAEILIEDLHTVILVRVTYSLNNNTAPFRIIYIDKNGMETVSGQITPANTAIDDGSSRYLAETIVLPSYGARGFKIRLDDAPSAGDVDTYGASA